MKQIYIIVALVLTAAGAHAQTQDQDFQVWNETTLSIPLIKEKDSSGKEIERVSLNVFGLVRFGQNRLALVDERVGAGLDIRLNKSFTFSPSYLYAGAQPARGRREFEHRLRFDLGYGKSWKNFSIKDRNRIEYRIRNSRDDSVRYRNKLTFSVPVKKGDKELFTPFISEEIYYDLTAREFARNEISPGISRKLNSYTTAEFFYLWRHNTTGTLRNVHAVGVNLKFKLK